MKFYKWPVFENVITHALQYYYMLTDRYDREENTPISYL
jgi:hypothetical protein